MSWAAKRRLLIFLIAGAVFAALLAVVGIATFYETPSCSDGVANQDESGIDCGGSCAHLCPAEVRPPTVLFTKILRTAEGRIDVIAMVENKNPAAAARNVPFTLELYGADRLPVGTTPGMLDIPPGTAVPVFLPGISVGKQEPASAFLLIDGSLVKWYRQAGDPRLLPSVATTRQSGTADAPRIDATLTNPHAAMLTNVRVVVLARNEQREVIAASQTVVPVIAAQGQAVATFTWSVPFPATVTSIEIVPIVPLPR